MFRAQQNAFDDAVGEYQLFLTVVHERTHEWIIRSYSCFHMMTTSPDTMYVLHADLPFYIAKATDENLTSENWEYILVRPLFPSPFRYYSAFG